MVDFLTHVVHAIQARQKGEMIDAKKDEREWLVTVIMPNTRCPCRYYPADYIGCTIQTGEKNDCNMDRCPLKGPDKKERD